MVVPHIICEGDPYQIGLTHGQEAREQVLGSIAFYKDMFQRTAKLDWPAVCAVAHDQFEENIKQKWPDYLEEMKGIADGAGVHLSDIIALNVRTEIAFGLFSDGCTTVAWKGNEFSYLAQNWDWMPAQKANLVHLTITRTLGNSTSTLNGTKQFPFPANPATPTPTISILTEAGIIGKIGLNSSSVGVCFNALRAQGIDASKLPAHLALRMALESHTAAEAIDKIEKAGGVAAACCITVSDGTSSSEAISTEWSAKGVKKIGMKAFAEETLGKSLVHANHYLVTPDEGIKDTRWLPDSMFRQTRMEELVQKLGGEVGEGDKLGREDVKSLFEDRANAPKSIARNSLRPEDSETLFNVIMDLAGKKAWFSLGRADLKAEDDFEVYSA